MITFLLATALAAPSGFTVTKTDVSGCELSKGPADDQGDVPMYAECVWPDVTVDKFHSVFQDWTKHDDIFSSVSASKVQRDGDKKLVFQTHVARGISNRDILLWGELTQKGEGWRYAWTKASDEPLTAASGHVVCERSDGWWEVQPRAEGGVNVTYELRYDPGGSVPGFLVRSFQTSGFAAVVTELHEYLN
ncbi:MAG: hypothetical protein KC912_07890 [Proteobacteria bacterium]|nr:hypothetical protein [Pseudomonadota bacterium]